MQRRSCCHGELKPALSIWALVGATDAPAGQGSRPASAAKLLADASWIHPASPPDHRLGPLLGGSAGMMPGCCLREPASRYRC